MIISDLKDKHRGQAGFCLGTAPHLNRLDLDLLKDKLTIGCNQLVNVADRYALKYICFQRQTRFLEQRDTLQKTEFTTYIVPESVLSQNTNWERPAELAARICSTRTRFATPGHAESFSFDLNNCAYAGDIIALEIQLAVWMGCNPIYILGVDAEFRDKEDGYFDASSTNHSVVENSKQYVFPEMKEWLLKARDLLWARGIKIYNAAGSESSLGILPKMRLKAATGSPKIAVTSKTFSQDSYLVKELRRFFPDFVINDRGDSLKNESLVEFLRDSDAAILGTECLTADVMDQLPCFRFVSKYGVGLNNIDFDAAKRHDIEVRYRKGVNSDSVAELVVALTIMMIRKIDESIQGYRAEQWSKLPGLELAELTIGIIGYGHVGKAVVEKFSALGAARILVNDVLDFPPTPPVEFVPLDYLLSESDIVTIHIEMEPKNHHLVNADFLSEMKEGSYLLNTSRGEVVDEGALAEALLSGHLSGAAIDVYENEPTPNTKLISCPNLLTTCHVAGSSNRAIKNMGWASIEGLLELFQITPTP